MREIVTLQFGQQANYLGTHFWNEQESYFTYGPNEESPVDHDIHFRPGVGADGAETYTPRTIIYDLKGAFGTLRRDNALYSSGGDQSQEQGQWPGQAQTIQQPAIPQSAYQQSLNAGLEPTPLTTSTVRYWSDYTRVFYHPRSIIQLNEYELNSSLAPFERWSSGEELFDSLDREGEIIDSQLRPWLEECDMLQGVQVFAGVDDAWGGFAGRYLEGLRDELGKGCVWVWGLEEGGRVARDRQLLRTGNTIQSTLSTTATASLYVPISSVPGKLPSYINSFDQTSRWHTSALQCTALESLTLPLRLRSSNNSRISMAELEDVFSNNGLRKVGALGMALSKPTEEGETNGHITHDDRVPGSVQRDDETQIKQDISFFPRPSSLLTQHSRTVPSPASPYASIISLRGSHLSTLELESLNQESRDRWSAAASSNNRTSYHQTDLLFNLLSSYPDLYPDLAGEKKVAVSANLETTKEVAGWIRGLEGLARSVRGVVNFEDREAVLNGLGALAEGFEEEGFDSDDDDD